MPGVNGPSLDKLKERLVKRYANTRLMLIQRMQEDYPYGAERIPPAQQYANFLAMQPEDYESLIYTLNDKYRGLPDSVNRVNTDLAAFMSHMLGLMMMRGG